MPEERREAPIVELSRPLTAYLVGLIRRDLPTWGVERRSRLSREEVTAFAEYLSDSLQDMRTEVPALPAMLRAG